MLAWIQSYNSEMSDAPSDSLPPEIEVLEREARQHPNSEWRNSRLVGAFCRSDLQAHPRRLELIIDFISRFPRSAAAKCAIVHADPVVAPEAFEAIEALWSRLRNGHADDPDLAIGHAALVANQDRCRAAEILRSAVALLPGNAALWTELGRIAPSPSEQYDALQKARALGSSQPNLLVWIGRSALDAGRIEDVFSVGCELMARARQTCDTAECPVDWNDTGSATWERIRAALEGSPERSQRIGELTQYANDTHWGHTFLGLVAVERGQLLEAGEHLVRSSKVWGEPRLSTYGPSFLLARKLCEAGMWNIVEEFLIACRDIWDDEILNDWIEDVRGERMPDFDEQ